MKTTKTCLSAAALLSMVLAPTACISGGGDPGDDIAGDPPAAAPAEISTEPAAGHMMPMPGTRAPRKRSGSDGQYNFTYHGGALIQNVKIVTVFWGSNVDNQSSLNQFYGAIVQSPYVDWLSEYDAGQQSIGRGTFVTSYVDQNAPGGGQLADQDIQQELTKLLASGAVPAADANTLYMVHFPAGVSITMSGATSCQQFCAYHSSFQNGGGVVYYGVMPDFSGACASCGGAGDKLSSTTVVSSHEVVESITDPGIGIANQTQQESYLAWYDTSIDDGEIADVCEGHNDTVNGWAVQQVYSMQQGACITTKAGAEPGQPGQPGQPGEPGQPGQPGGGGQAGCAHGVCLTGAPLLPSCGPCTAKVTQADPHCGADTWDDACVRESVSICGKRCQ